MAQGRSGSAAAGSSAPVPKCPDYATYRSVFGTSGGPPPAGSSGPGTWYIDLCATGDAQSMATGLIWFPTGQRPTAAVPPSQVAAAEAASQLRLPRPTIEMSPSETGYVNLPEWLWIDPALWRPFTTTAQACNQAGCSSATAIAAPLAVVWNLGDGASITCPGPGTPYRQGASPTAPGACTYTYPRSSAGQPSPDGNPDDAAFTVTATVHWGITWHGAGHGGTLAPVATRSATPLRVAEIETVNR